MKKVYLFYFASAVAVNELDLRQKVEIVSEINDADIVMAICTSIPEKDTGDVGLLFKMISVFPNKDFIVVIGQGKMLYGKMKELHDIKNVKVVAVQNQKRPDGWYVHQLPIIVLPK
jgi:hypothetical protein